MNTSSISTSSTNTLWAQLTKRFKGEHGHIHGVFMEFVLIFPPNSMDVYGVPRASSWKSMKPLVEVLFKTKQCQESSNTVYK